MDAASAELGSAGLDGVESTGAPPRGHGRWWAAAVVGTAAGLPLAWVLSYAAALPYFIGVFFFALGGLIVGAVAYRVARAGRPYAIGHLIAGTTLIVLTSWGATLVKEARDFPFDMVAQAERVRDLGGRTIDVFRQDVEAEVRAYLSQKFPPGGPLGYIRWVVTTGEISRGELGGVERTLRASQSGLVWMLRVVISAGLLAFGVGSQTLNLRLEREPSVRMMDGE